MIRYTDRLLQELKLYANELGSIRKLIDNGDGAGLEKLFAAARDAQLLADEAKYERMSRPAFPFGDGRAEGQRGQHGRPTTLRSGECGLGVSEDMPDELPDDDPRAPHLGVYHWLTWVQDTLVEAMMP